MPTLKKLLSKFSKEDRDILEFLIQEIVSLEWHGLDVKKLKGYEDIFRVHKGKLRIVFNKHNKSIYIITVERRNETTYKL